MQTEQIQIRLLLKTQFDHGLHCLQLLSASFGCITALIKPKSFILGKIMLYLVTQFLEFLWYYQTPTPPGVVGWCDGAG